MDTWIEVDVSGLETREQKAAIEKAFEDCGWTYDRYIPAGYERITGIAIIRAYRFHWDRFGEPVYPPLPPGCRIAKNPLA